MDEVQVTKRGRGRPRKAARGVFSVNMKGVGTVHVAITAPANDAIGISAVDALARAIRANLSKSNKAVTSPTPVLVQS